MRSIRYLAALTVLAMTTAVAAQSQMKQYKIGSSNPPFTGKILGLQKTGETWAGTWENINAGGGAAPHSVVFTIEGTHISFDEQGGQHWTGSINGSPSGRITFEAVDTSGTFKAVGDLDLSP